MTENPALVGVVTRHQSRLATFKTHPVVHGTVHAVRRRRGRFEVGRLPAARHPAEAAVRQALRTALYDDPADATLARIETVRAEYLASDVRLTSEARGKTTTLAGAAGVSRSARDAWLLYQLVARLGAEYVVETGSCVGISAAYLAAALPADGRLVTLELFDDLVAQARQTLAAAGVEGRAEVVPGNIDDTLPGVLETLPRVDVAFIDGGHFMDRVLWEVDLFLEKARPGTVLAIDDIDWTADMREAWRRVGADGRFSECVDLGSLGLAVVGDDGCEPRTVRLHYA